MAMFAAIGPIISGIASLAGAMVSASAARSQADAERSVAEWNARELEKQAAVEQSKGALESARVAREAEQQRAKIVASNAQGGLDTTTGTPALLNNKLASLAFFEENVRMFNARSAQRRLETEAITKRFEGEVKATSLENQAVAGLLGGFAGAVKGIGGGLASGGGGGGSMFG